MSRRDDLRVPVEKLRYVCKPENFQFRDTSEVEPLKDFIGQDKAVQALLFGLEIDSPEYQLFATGHLGTGRRAVLLNFLENLAKKRMDTGEVFLKDFCYIHNFDKPEQPKILIFEQSRGKRFKAEMDNILKTFKKEIPVVLFGEECLAAKEEIQKEFEEKIKKINEQLKKNKSRLMVIQSPDGRIFVQPISKENPEKPIEETEYESLSEEEKKKLSRSSGTIIRKIKELRKKANKKAEELTEELVSVFLESAFAALSREYPDYPEILRYFKGLRDYVLDNLNLFQENNRVQQNGQDPFLPFKVNLFVDNSNKTAPPVIFESQPTSANLFGRIEKKFALGAYLTLTDHTYLRPGSLCLANEGYLVLNILDMNLDVWTRLKKTLRAGYLKIEEPLSYLGLTSTDLNPEPIPIRLKVIVMGDPFIYHLLVEHDPEFLAIFKAKVEFDSEMKLTPESLNSYAGFIADCCQKKDLRTKEKLLPFDATAAAKIVEHGARLAEDQTKLSTKFDEIKNLVTESNYWAKKTDSPVVSSEHVKKAVEAKRLRMNLTEARVRESIRDEMLLIDTKGEKVGQINGLTVLELGDYYFGRPARITATTSLGKSGLISIQREVKMSGSIHDSGVFIFYGYFKEKYGKDKLLSFSASLCFEQSYSGVEGDSASAAELFCLISSLAELHISQELAITGSINQKGEIQPIGYVNQKIEGFFDACKEKGLSGSQGVIIPHRNIRNLMLREDVVEAVVAGQFNVFAISNVDEGIELLMNNSAETVHQKVDERLIEMQKKLKEYEENESS